MAAKVVLVHGAWHGAWCFDRVLPELERRGIDAVAVDLPGHAGDPRPLGDLHGDADSVKEVLDGIDGPVVLLGHSYGGAVITEAGTHPNVRHLVYLCALMLDGHETCGSAMADDPEAQALDHSQHALGEALTFDETGTVVTVDPELAAAALYNQVDAETVAWAISRLSPQPMATFTQEPAGVAWREKPSTYVVCTEDRAVHPGLQRLFARERATSSVEWDADHSPFLTRPGAVADLLAELARSLD